MSNGKHGSRYTKRASSIVSETNFNPYKKYIKFAVGEMHGASGGELTNMQKMKILQNIQRDNTEKNNTEIQNIYDEIMKQARIKFDLDIKQEQKNIRGKEGDFIPYIPMEPMPEERQPEAGFTSEGEIMRLGSGGRWILDDKLRSAKTPEDRYKIITEHQKAVEEYIKKLKKRNIKKLLKNI